MFDWNDFKVLAEELKQKDDEASKRTAVSRIYYATYWQARGYLEDEGFSLRSYEGSHVQIWNEFKRKSGLTAKAIGRFGGELHRFRVDADYFSEITKIENLTEDSFQLAEKISTYLQQIQNKQ
jgi:uncharacterized protein (UPF0332 family)